MADDLSEEVRQLRAKVLVNEHIADALVALLGEVLGDDAAVCRTVEEVLEHASEEADQHFKAAAERRIQYLRTRP